MKKAFKLVLTFIIVLGVILACFALIIDDAVGPKPVPREKISVYCDQIEQEWEQRGDWDEDLFLSHCDLIKQLGREYNVVPVQDMLTSTVVVIAHEKVFAAWQSPTCKRETVDKYMKAIKAISKQDADAKFNPLVEEINKVDKVYRNAYGQAYRKIELNPSYNGRTWKGFDKYGNEWASFSAYGQRVRQDRDNMLGNTIYKTYLSNIKDIKDRLNNIPERIAQARTSFYTALAKEIANYYNDVPASTRSRDQLNDLRSSRANYESEYGESEVINNCASLFNRDVNKNESGY